MPQDQLLKISEVAQRLNLSRSTVMTLVARGDIASLKIGRARRVQTSRLDAWIAERAANESKRREMATLEVESEVAEEAGPRAAAHPG